MEIDFPGESQRICGLLPRAPRDEERNDERNDDEDDDEEKEENGSFGTLFRVGHLYAGH